MLIRLSRSIIILSFFALSFARADWPCRTDTTLPVVDTAGNQWNLHAASDGTRGAILVWQDRRSGSTDKVYLQRLSSSGLPMWQPQGVPVAATPGFQYYPQIVADGSGGAVVAWQDNRNGADYDIYVQRLGPGGVPLWAANGVRACGAPGHQYNPQLVADRSGGFIVTWQDRRGGEYDIYSQRIDTLGNPQWTTDGLILCSAVNDQIEPKIASDGAGGAVVAWLDYRSGSGYTDVYCQRVGGTGVLAWANDGVAVCQAAGTQWNQQILEDGIGNAIVVWQDRRSGLYDNIFAQKLTAAGAAAWQVDGIPVAPIAGMQYYPQAVSDGAGTTLIVWQDNRVGGDYDIYAQRVTPGGQITWPTSGMAICNATGHQYYPELAAGATSLVVTWQDKRGGQFDIYAQRMKFNGQLSWEPNGVPVAELPSDQFMPQLTSDGAEGAIIAWADYHLGQNATDIFAHRLGANGEPAGGCFRSFPQTSLGQVGVRLYKKLPPTTFMPNEGNVRDSIFGRGAFSQGIFLGVERTDSIRSYGWIYFTRSFYVRRALPQNGGARPFDRQFDHPFIGKLKNPSIRRYNNRLAGELLTLKLNIAASDVGITSPGFGELMYSNPDVPTHPFNNKSLRDLSAFVDSMLTYYRRFPTTNWSSIANALAAINGAFAGRIDTVSTKPLVIRPAFACTSVPFLVPSGEQAPPLPAFIPQLVDEDLPESYMLLQNYPNPFNPLTTIEFVLPEDATVSVTVYNALGQEVVHLLDHVAMSGGRQAVDFDASALSSGVYFYRLIAEPIDGTTRLRAQVKKMLLIK